jgi:phosphate:Na+ symporter
VLESAQVDRFMQAIRIIKDLERIGDHCENLIEFFDTIETKGEIINQQGKADIITMLNLAAIMIEKAIRAYDQEDVILAKEIVAQDDDLDRLNEETRNRHIERFAKGVAEKNRYSAMVYIDLLSNIERMGDHAVNIADTIIDLHQKR